MCVRDPAAGPRVSRKMCGLWQSCHDLASSSCRPCAQTPFATSQVSHVFIKSKDASALLMERDFVLCQAPLTADTRGQVCAAGPRREQPRRTRHVHARIPVNALHEEPLSQGPIRRGETPSNLRCRNSTDLTLVRFRQRSCITCANRCHAIRVVALAMSSTSTILRSRTSCLA